MWTRRTGCWRRRCSSTTVGRGCSAIAGLSGCRARRVAGAHRGAAGASGPDTRRVPARCATARASRPQPALAWGAVRSADLDTAVATPESLLARFGLESFRPGQREAVQAALDGRDSLVVMPTGGGKSLCYQLPALAEGVGLVVVVSPLIALMSDQLRRLQDAGVSAAMLASGMGEGQNEARLREIEDGSTQL